VVSELRHLYRTVLITADDLRTGINLADEVTSCGCTVAGPFADNARALAWLEGGHPDLVLLDVLLSDRAAAMFGTVLADDTPIAIWANFEPVAGIVRASVCGRDGPYRDHTVEALLDEVLEAVPSPG
jgi:hypothetical protein